ncbi:MAG: hypothetical protein DYG89_28525 [Caldilinea sp. CFX5]|nr:hypothetical protein [Caldilinea sp. CFX5]
MRQFIQGNGFALNRQPDQNLAFQWRQADKLLGKDGANVIKDNDFLVQKRSHVAGKEILNGARHQLQGQWIARIALSGTGGKA